MFARREKHTLQKRFREAIWPSMGWRRAFLFYRHFLLRAPGSTYKIVGGLSVGIAVSFLPTLGFHLAQSYFFGWLLRVNKMAAWIGTAFGNPITFPVMFWLDYKLGAFIVGFWEKNEYVVLPKELTWSFMLSDPLSVFLPMFLGGVIMAVAAWPVSYLLLYYPVQSMRRGYRDHRNGK